MLPMQLSSVRANQLRISYWAIEPLRHFHSVLCPFTLSVSPYLPCFLGNLFTSSYWAIPAYVLRWSASVSILLFHHPPSGHFSLLFRQQSCTTTSSATQHLHVFSGFLNMLYTEYTTVTVSHISLHFCSSQAPVILPHTHTTPQPSRYYLQAEVVAADERESTEGVRATLNLGHTFGHAIETGTGYGVWLHGEAVAAGTVMAADMSYRLVSGVRMLPNTHAA